MRGIKGWGGGRGGRESWRQADCAQCAVLVSIEYFPVSAYVLCQGAHVSGGAHGVHRRFVCVSVCVI
jgi:hypothetical protein